MGEDVQGLAYSLLGVLVGLIFILDGWRSSAEDTGWLQRSPKIRGLLFVLGAGIIPAIQAVLGKDQGVLAIYALAFVATSLVLLMGMAGYALLVASKRLADVQTGWSRSARLVESLPFVAMALLEGLPRFHSEIDRLLVRALVDQREWALDFILGFLEALDQRRQSMNEGRVSLENALNFMELSLQDFVLNLFSDSTVLESHRAALYFRPPDADQLFFVLGVSPWSMPHSGAPLPVVGSVAGTALQKPRQEIAYSANNKQSAPLYRGEREPQFQALVARAVLQVTASPDRAEWVLCIDAAEDFGPDALKYRSRMILVMCLLLAYARKTLDISTQDLVGACQSSRQSTDGNAGRDVNR